MTKIYQEEDNLYETIIGRDGKPKRVLRPKDSNLLNILQDGERMRVSLFDSLAARDQQSDFAARKQLSDAERYVMEDMAHRHASAGNRPGFRYLATEEAKIARHRVRDAYAAYDQERESAWVDPNSNSGAGEQQFIGQREGDLCTRDGWPGRLRYNHEGDLECVLDHPNGSADHRTLDQRMEDHQLRMDEEYRAYARRKSEEWRGR